MRKTFQGVCNGCGITYLSGSQSSTWCSQRCSKRAYWQRRKARELRPMQLQLMPAASNGLEVRAWQGTPIQRRAADGYVNATAMCQANGKRWTLYQVNERTQAYIHALAADVGIPTSALTTSIKGGVPDLQGTWIHPRLAVDLARWISPAFAVWMDGWFLEATQQPAPVALQPAVVDPLKYAETLLFSVNLYENDHCAAESLCHEIIYQAQTIGDYYTKRLSGALPPRPVVSLRGAADQIERISGRRHLLR
jgi:hypothetical protein